MSDFPNLWLIEPKVLSVKRRRYQIIAWANDALVSKLYVRARLVGNSSRASGVPNNKTTWRQMALMLITSV